MQNFPKKAKEGKLEETNHCVCCLQGCFGEAMKGNFTCLVNPRCTREFEHDLLKADNTKNVMIIGAGPGGLMAARTAAQRGHNVTVYDKDTHFGGVFRSAAYPMGKGELSTVISAYRKQCEVLGVIFKMGQEVSEDIIKEARPDTIVVATGSVPLTPPIEGINSENVVTAEDVLYGKKDVNQGPVVVCGGGELGGETAEFIAQTNHDVTILEMKPAILTDMVVTNMIPTMERLHQQQIKIVTNATVSKINENAVSYKNADGDEITIPASTVVSAFGYKAYNPLENVAKENCNEVYVIGSAVKAGNALTAIQDGYQAGLKL